MDAKEKKNAAIIARLIEETDTDERHVLYLEIARQLEYSAQFYSASLFALMAVKDFEGTRGISLNSLKALRLRKRN